MVPFVLSDFFKIAFNAFSEHTFALAVVSHSNSAQALPAVSSGVVSGYSLRQGAALCPA